MRDLEEQHANASDSVAMATQIQQDELVDDNSIDAINNGSPPKPCLFTQMKDPNGYNCCIISKAQIDSILLTEFLHRKAIQQSKMLALDSKILKLA